MAFDIIIGRDNADKKKFGDAGTIFLGKSYVTMGRTTSLSNNVFLDINRPHIILCTGKRGSGKCLVGDTQITLGDGSVKPIKDLEQDNNLILSLNEKLKIKKTEKVGFYKRIVDNILKVKLRSGREIELTPEHPLFTIKGWKPANELTIGSRIAVPRKQEVFGNEFMEENKIKILAYMIAEGHTKKNILFSNSDEKIVNEFSVAIKEFDSELSLVKEKENHYRISKVGFYGGGRNKGNLRLFFEKHKLWGRGSIVRTIPECIFKLPKEQLALFLNRLFSCDGSVYKSKKGSGYGWEISYSSSSNKMIKQVQHLLFRFGILSRLRNKKVKCRGKLFDTWEIVINPENCIGFIKEIGFFGEKEEKQERCLLDVVDIKRNPNVDTIPKEMWDLYKPKNWAKIGRDMGYKYPKAMRERIKYACSRQTLLQVAESEQNNPLYLLATSDIFWDEIISIEQLEGEFEVYDISVPKMHNFVANDIIVHNSWSLSVIAEQISSAPKEVKQNLSVIMFDTMGIFWTMKYPNNRDAKLLEQWGEKPETRPINIYIPEGFFDEYKEKGIPVDFGFSIKTSELNAGDWCDVFDIKLTDPIGILIERIVGDLQDSHEEYGIGEILEKIRSDIKTIKEVREATENRFLAANKWGLFKKQGIKISDILKPGKISVIDLSIYARMSGEWKIKNLVVGLLSRKLLSERIGSRKFEELEEIEKGESYFEDRKNLDKPLVWMMIDECHQFLRKDEKTSASDALIALLREGRQPGISMILATQQPGIVHRDVLTQSDIILSHRLTAKEDINALNSMMQSYLLNDVQTYMNKLPDLKGSAIVLDDNSERIYPIRVKPKVTWHGGGSPTAIRLSKKKGLSDL